MIIKFNRRFLLITVLIILIIALVSVYAGYYRPQASEQSELEDELSQDNTTFNVLASQISNLESQLDQRNDELEVALEDLDMARERFPESVESIDYHEILFGIAADWNLEITLLTISEPDQEEVAEDIIYQVTSFSVDIKPTNPPLSIEENNEVVADMLQFVDTIAINEDFNNASIELVNMTGLEFPGDPVATIQLKIYSYQGE